MPCMLRMYFLPTTEHVAAMPASGRITSYCTACWLAGGYQSGQREDNIIQHAGGYQSGQREDNIIQHAGGYQSGQREDNIIQHAGGHQSGQREDNTFSHLRAQNYKGYILHTVFRAAAKKH